jgi:hypothetical protein
MFVKRWFDSGAKALLLAALLCSSAQIVRGQAASSETWKDSATGLTWAVKDNGHDVNSGQARDYCGTLRVGGFSDWRLPSIEELEALYDKGAKKIYKTKGPIEMSDSCALSGTTNPTGEVWSFCFSYGGKTLARAQGHGSAGRALCVRKAD